MKNILGDLLFSKDYNTNVKIHKLWKIMKLKPARKCVKRGCNNYVIAVSKVNPHSAVGNFNKLIT